MDIVVDYPPVSSWERSVPMVRRKPCSRQDSAANRMNPNIPSWPSCSADSVADLPALRSVYLSVLVRVHVLRATYNGYNVVGFNVLPLALQSWLDSILVMRSIVAAQGTHEPHSSGDT